MISWSSCPARSQYNLRIFIAIRSRLSILAGVKSLYTFIPALLVAAVWSVGLTGQVYALQLSPNGGSAFQGGDSYLTEDKRQSLAEVQRQLWGDRPDSAHMALNDFIAANPVDPIGYVYRAAVYMNQMTHAEDDVYSGELKIALDSIEALCDRWPAHGSRDTAWMHLCRGHAHAYRSLYESRFGSFASAIKQAYRARASYENGLGADSTLYDLYGGLGMYHYWKSAKAGFLRWLGLFKNEMEKGIGELYLAADSSLISAEAARNALIWIWLNQGQYDSVIVTCHERLTVFPDSRLFLWPLAEAYFKKKEYAPAAGIYTRLRQILSTAPGNCYNLVDCDYSLNQCFIKMGQDREAVLAARSIETYYDDIPDKVKRRQRSKIDFLRRVAKRDIR